MKKTLALIIALAALAGALFFYSRRPAPLPELARTPRAYDVRILRDEWGVPHIFGKTDADVAYGLAYAHAEDDFATIQGALLAARGKLAAVFGKAAAPNDYMVHLLRIWDVVNAGYDSLAPQTRALCAAYAEGLNDFAARHPERAYAELYPVRGQDLVAGFVHKVPLFFGIGDTLKKLLEATPHTNAAQPASAEAFFNFPSQTLGSNTFSVSPKRSADGSTLLAVNSHQPWEGPVAWYEVHLHSDEGWEAVGGVFPGAPVVLHGHNRDLGWAHTVNEPDVLDVYELEINPENANQYRFDGIWRELEIRTAPIEVKLFGPLRWTFKREVLWSVHGPVVRAPGGTFAVRFAGFGETRHIEQWYRMNRARNFAEWQSAMHLQAIPMFNTGYADREGNIYYLYNARLPARPPGYNWQGRVPGNTSATLWQEYVAFEQLPQVKNPNAGFVQNCNSSPYFTTIGADNPPLRSAWELGIETHMTNRALRALELLGGAATITAEEFQTFKFDVAYSPFSTMAQLLRQVLRTAPRDSLLRAAHAVLRAWNLQTDPENPHAAMAVLAFRDFIKPHVGAVAADTLRARLQAAALSLQQNYGRLDVPWQQVNRLRRGGVDLGMGGGPDVLHAVYGKPDGKGHLIGYVGDSYILLVRWDAHGRVSSQSIHQYGSATEDEKSPHYADQSAWFVRRELKPVWMEEADIRAHLSREYRPGESK
ncbi:MAG: acylase [bacterium]